MKWNFLLDHSAVALAALSLSLVSCKDGDKKNDGGGDGGGGGPSSASKPLAEQIVGSWAPDKESFAGFVKEMMAKDMGGAPPAVLEKVVPAMVDAMGDLVAFKIDGEKAWAISPEGFEEQGTYKITSENAATGELTVESTDADGNVEEKTARLEGDTLVMVEEGIEMKMTRISDAEFDARKEKIANFDIEAVMGPIMQEAMGSLLQEGGLPGALPPGAAPGTAPGLPPGIDIPDIAIPDEPN